MFVYDWINNGSLVTPAGQPFYFNDSLGRYFATQADYYTDNNDCLGDKWCVSNIFGVNRTGKGAFKLFYEVNPLNQENINLAPSNRVYILHDMPAEGIDDFSVPFTPFYPDIYDIQFLEETYKPVIPADPQLWGCVEFLEPWNGFQAGDGACPSPIPADPCADQFSWSCMAALWDLTVEQYNSAIDEATGWLASQVAVVIPFCNDTCTGLLQSGFKMAISYVTGIPPNLPNSGSMLEMGIDIAADYVFDDIIPAELGKSDIYNNLSDEAKLAFSTGKDQLKGEFKSKMKDWLVESKRARSGHIPVTCQYPDVAKSHGKLPVCIDPNIAWQPLAGSEITPPSIQVKITRKPLDQNNNYGTDSTKVGPADGKHYSLKISSATTNTYRVGTIIPMYGGYVENYNTASCTCTHTDSNSDMKYCDTTWAWKPCWFVVEQPLKARPYKELELPIPWMEPGESTIMTIDLPLEKYWYTDHLTALDHLQDAVYQYTGDDWLYLYYHGETTLKAEEVCENNMPERAFCGSGDEFKPPVPVP